MAKSAMYAVIAVVIIAIVVIGAAIALGWINLGTTPTPTPTPTISPTPTPATATDITTATNLTYTASVTSGGTTTSYSWIGKNIHSNAPVIRVDFANYAYILDASQQQSWNSTNSGTTWTQGNFTADWIAWGSQWSDYVNNLSHWSGSGSYTYVNTFGENIVITSVTINQPIPDSVFAVS